MKSAINKTITCSFVIILNQFHIISSTKTQQIHIDDINEDIGILLNPTKNKISTSIGIGIDDKYYATSYLTSPLMNLYQGGSYNEKIELLNFETNDDEDLDHLDSMLNQEDDDALDFYLNEYLKTIQENKERETNEIETNIKSVNDIYDISEELVEGLNVIDETKDEKVIHDTTDANNGESLINENETSLEVEEKERHGETPVTNNENTIEINENLEATTTVNEESYQEENEDVISTQLNQNLPGEEILDGAKDDVILDTKTAESQIEITEAIQEDEFEHVDDNNATVSNPQNEMNQDETDLTNDTTTTTIESDVTLEDTNEDNIVEKESDTLEDTNEDTIIEKESDNEVNRFDNELIFVERNDDGEEFYEFDDDVSLKDVDNENYNDDEVIVTTEVPDYSKDDSVDDSIKVINDTDTVATEDVVIENDFLNTTFDESSNDNLSTMEETDISNDKAIIDADTTIVNETVVHNDISSSTILNNTTTSSSQIEDEKDSIESSSIQEESTLLLNEASLDAVDSNTSISQNITASALDGNNDTTSADAIMDNATENIPLNNTLQHDDRKHDTSVDNTTFEDPVKMIINDITQLEQQELDIQEPQDDDSSTQHEQVLDIQVPHDSSTANVQKVDDTKPPLENINEDTNKTMNTTSNKNQPTFDNDLNISQTKTSSTTKEYATKINMNTEKQEYEVTDFHQILEHIEPAEELESVPPGSSIQEVLVSKTIQIVLQKILFIKNFLVKLASKVSNKQVMKEFSISVWNGIKDFWNDIFGNDGYTSSDSNELKDLQDKVLNQIKKNDDIDFSDFRGLKDKIGKNVESNDILKDMPGMGSESEM